MNQIEQRAYDRFTRRLSLIREIYGIEISMSGYCSGLRCNRTHNQKTVFDQSYRLSKNYFLCPVCDREINIRIVFLIDKAKLDYHVPKRENFDNLNFFSLTLQQIFLFVIFFHGSIREFAKRTDYTKSEMLDYIKPNKNWAEIVLSQQYDILPATEIASIVNQPVSKIRQLRKNRPKN